MPHRKLSNKYAVVVVRAERLEYILLRVTAYWVVKRIFATLGSTVSL